MTSKTQEKNMPLDVLRGLFPHASHTIYLNHAALSPMSRPVTQALATYIEERSNSNVENYFDFMPIIDETLERLAMLIGTTSDRVAFAPNTSYGLNILAQGLNWKPGDRIAIPGCEFPANVYPFMNLQAQGVAVDFIPHVEGRFSLADIERTITPQTRLLSISWVQFLSGFKVQLKEVSALCKAHDVLLCVDAIQGLGALQLDVQDSGVDFLACGGHKWMMGVMGTGFVYVNKSLQDQLTSPAGWLHGPVDWERLDDYELQFHPDARRYRLGTLNNMGIAAVHAALGLYYDCGPTWCEAQVLKLAHQLGVELHRLGYDRYGSSEIAHASGIVTIRHPEVEDLFAHLERHHIAAALRNRLLRFSPTYYNSLDEINRVLEVLASFGKERIFV